RQADVRYALWWLVRQDLLSLVVDLYLRPPQGEPPARVLAEPQAQPAAGLLPAAQLRRPALREGPERAADVRGAVRPRLSRRRRAGHAPPPPDPSALADPPRSRGRPPADH